MKVGNLVKRLLPQKSGASASVPLRYEAEARLYEFERRYFVCSVRGIAETASVSVLDAACEDDEVGGAILRHLGEYSPDGDDLSGLKLTDWPAFRASGAKSVKAFERGLWHVDLAIMNSAVMIWAAPRRTQMDTDLSTYAAANRDLPASVGAAMRSALTAVKLLRESGGI